VLDWRGIDSILADMFGFVHQTVRLVVLEITLPAWGAAPSETGKREFELTGRSVL
jgi:hypothetical protein